MKIISLFSGAGGLDIGFYKAGFQTIWANEFDSKIWDTFEHNFPNVYLEKKDIRKIHCSDIPNDIDGIIGGPPCQSFSEAGKGLGEKDSRGKLFFEYVRILQDKNPKFFVAENVSGILHNKHKQTRDKLIKEFNLLDYDVSFQLLNANDYDVPQDRKRVFFIGYRKDLNKKFNLPCPRHKKLLLKNVIWDLKDNAVETKHNKPLNGSCYLANHEYMSGGFSPIYMSRNRVRSWNEPSFTIQASGRHAPIHPQAPKMEKVKKDVMKFVQGKENMYRRLSVRECARIQTFPDDYEFLYNNLYDGYKMVGNAVPINLSYIIAEQIKQDLFTYKNLNDKKLEY